ncbi:hypothetical protein [Nocardia jiangsuensis]|uniref:Uncharacterized protein n=1 Tax=Nocardia jiangsuensis TaxID=1691563 RepID=A0ABV8E0I0_9NOCA
MSDSLFEAANSFADRHPALFGELTLTGLPAIDPFVLGSGDPLGFGAAFGESIQTGSLFPDPAVVAPATDVYRNWLRDNSIGAPGQHTAGFGQWSEAAGSWGGEFTQATSGVWAEQGLAVLFPGLAGAWYPIFDRLRRELFTPRLMLRQRRWRGGTWVRQQWATIGARVRSRLNPGVFRCRSAGVVSALVRLKSLLVRWCQRAEPAPGQLVTARSHPTRGPDHLRVAVTPIRLAGSSRA